MTKLTAKQKLDEAIQEYVKETSGAEYISRTDYILAVHAIDLEYPSNASFYYYAHSGPTHAQAGLVFMAQEEIKMLNREEAQSHD